MSIIETQSYKEVVQLALKVKKLTDERISHSNFKREKDFILYLDSHLKGVEVLILLVLVQSDLPSLFDILNCPNLACHH